MNWFRKTPDGKWLWPGYGENSRVLEWMCKRVDGQVWGHVYAHWLSCRARATSISNGMNLPQENVNELLRVDVDAWKTEIADIEKHFAQFGGRLPARLRMQLDELKTRLGLDRRNPLRAQRLTEEFRMTSATLSSLCVPCRLSSVATCCILLTL